MSNGNNGFLTIGGWSPSRSERLNEIWEMVCDPAEENCNDWTIKAYFDQSRQPPLVSMWIPESVAPSSFGCPGASIKGDIYVPKCWVDLLQNRPKNLWLKCPWVETQVNSALGHMNASQACEDKENQKQCKKWKKKGKCSKNDIALKCKKTCGEC